MKNITRTQYQAFPFHLVEPSPWKILGKNKRYFTRNINPNNINLDSKKVLTNKTSKVDYQSSEKYIKESIILSANELGPVFLWRSLLSNGPREKG